MIESLLVGRNFVSSICNLNLKTYKKHMVKTRFLPTLMTERGVRPGKIALQQFPKVLLRKTFGGLDITWSYLGKIGQLHRNKK